MDDTSSPSRPDDGPDHDTETEPASPPSVRGSGVPPVVAVVVTCDRGPDLAVTLESLDAQEYANLSVLVVDAGSAEDPTPTVADILPTAFVRRVGRVSWATAANEALGSVEGAAFLLFLHDDVALGPGSVQAMVEEAFRANAGIVGPKLVDWEEPDLLRSIGSSVDRFGFSWPIAEIGELDQSQHDAAREVFAVQAAALLIRGDLFSDLGGFSTDIDGACEDLDLCWRAKVAGGRTVIMPAAVVRHAASSPHADPPDPNRSLTLRHQVRIALACYSPFSLAKVVPQSMVLVPGDILLSVLGGRSREVRSIVAALAWNVAHLPTTLRIHARVSRTRRVSDSAIKPLQLTGSARLAALTRGTAESGDGLSGVGDTLRALPDALRRRNPGWVLAVWGALVALIGLGSRSLLTGRVPAVREFLPFGDASDLFSEWWSGWRTTGLGAASPAPTLLGIVGAVQSVSWADGLVRTLFLLGPLPWGAVALWRLFGPRFSPLARVAALVAYCLNPLPYNAISEGRWQALVVYGATPAILSSLLRIGGWEPFADTATAPSSMDTTVRAVGRLALVVALATAVAPAAALLTVVLGALIALAARASPGSGAGSIRRTGVGLAAALGLAFVIHLPWAWGVLASSNRWTTLIGANASGSAPPDLLAALRFETGSAGGALGLGLWIAPLVAVAVSRDSRFRWAVLSVSIATTSLFFVVLAGRLSPGVAMPSTEVLLAPAVTGIAIGVAMWIEAFVTDVSGRSFSWRQVASGVALVGAVLGLLPIIGLVSDGRWGAPASDIEQSLADIDADLAAQRTLRIGDADALGGRGWSFDDDLDVTVTDGPTAGLTNLFPHGRLAGEKALVEALGVAAQGQTTRLGSMLAPFGIDYVIVVDRLAPLPYGVDTIAAAGPLPAALAQQVDLQRVEVIPGVAVYRNTEVLPRRAAMDPDLGRSVADLSVVDVIAAGAIDAETVLEDRAGFAEYRGPLDDDSSVFVADNRDDRWSLSVGDARVGPEPAFQWASRYEVENGGDAVLSRRGSVSAVLGHLVQAVALALALAATVARPLRPLRPVRPSRSGRGSS